jgi:hypothetical protein
MGELPSNGIGHDSVTDPFPAVAVTIGDDGAVFGAFGVPLTSPVSSPTPTAFTAASR